nr:hypothetical protein [Tanacetum cinerariifolium]
METLGFYKTLNTMTTPFYSRCSAPFRLQQSLMLQVKKKFQASPICSLSEISKVNGISGVAGSKVSDGKLLQVVLVSPQVSKDACVADMVKEGNWIWPEDWWSKFPMLIEIQVPYFNTKKETAIWLNKTGLPVPFTIRDIWKSMRTDYSEVCTFACKVWNMMKNSICLDMVSHNWQCIIQIMQNSYCNNSIKGVLGRTGVAACVYNIWREINLRLFQNSKRTEEDVVKCLKEEIRWKLMSLKVKRSQAVTKVFKQWDICIRDGWASVIWMMPSMDAKFLSSVGGGCIEFGVCLHKGN